MRIHGRVGGVVAVSRRNAAEACVPELAFGSSGAQYGFAAAISVYIFLIVAVFSAIAFRRTRQQEEVFR